MNFKMDCNTDHVVYLLSCTKCSKQYVGSTITKSRTFSYLALRPTFLKRRLRKYLLISFNE